MKEFAADFFKRMAALMRESQAFGINGARLDFCEGIAVSHGIIRSAADAGKKVMIVGNGGSAGIASHITVDLWKNGGVKATAFNDSSLLTCIANDFGYKHVFEEPVKIFAERGDVLIAISSSGKSENILRAVSAAKERSCKVITMSGFGQDNPLKKTGDINFFVPAQGYGYVETVHAAICHALVDSVIKSKTV